MKKRKKATPTPDSNGSGPPLLATMTEEERQDYIKKTILLEQKNLETLAAMALLQQTDDHLMKKYALPVKFNISLETGQIREVPVDAEVPSVRTV